MFFDFRLCCGTLDTPLESCAKGIAMFLFPDQQLRRADRANAATTCAICARNIIALSVTRFSPMKATQTERDFLPCQGKQSGDPRFHGFWCRARYGVPHGSRFVDVSTVKLVKGRAVELVVDLGWKRHRGPGFQAEGLCYRPDGSVIKAVNPDNCWIPLIDAEWRGECGV